MSDANPPRAKTESNGERWAVLRFGPKARRAGLIRDMFRCTPDPTGAAAPCKHEHMFFEAPAPATPQG